MAFVVKSRNNDRPGGKGARPHRRIRSYVLREGRLTTGQQRAFDQIWPRLGLEFQARELDLEHVFGNSNPVFLEIGFGNGESLAEMARAHPDRNYLGVEVHGPGVGHLLLKLEEYGCTNVRVIRHDAVEVLGQMLARDSLQVSTCSSPTPGTRNAITSDASCRPRFWTSWRVYCDPAASFTPPPTGRTMRPT